MSKNNNSYNTSLNADTHSAALHACQLAPRWTNAAHGGNKGKNTEYDIIERAPRVPGARAGCKRREKSEPGGTGVMNVSTNA